MQPTLQARWVPRIRPCRHRNWRYGILPGSDEGYTNPYLEQELNHAANASKESGEIAHKEWVESHTPQEIVDANNARKLLRRRLNSPRKYHLIRDERIPKRPTSALLLFTKAKHASGDLKGVGDFKTTSALVVEDWKSLSEAERKVCHAPFHSLLLLRHSTLAAVISYLNDEIMRLVALPLRDLNHENKRFPRNHLIFISANATF